MALRTGAAASEEYSKGNQFADRLRYLNWQKDVEAFPAGILLRPLTDIDGWPVVDTHLFTPTKDKPANWTSDNWPKMMPAVCAYDPLFFDDAAMTVKYGDDPKRWPKGSDGIYIEGFGMCYIHLNYQDKKDRFGNPHSNADALTYALVVLRERTPDNKGVRDRMEKFKLESGEEIDVPMIRVVSARWTQFFSALAQTAFEDGSICTKDYLVKKKAKNSAEVSALSVSRTHHPAVVDNPVLGTADATDSWKFYESKLEQMGPAADLIADLTRQASVEHIHRFFEPGPWDEVTAEDTESAEAATEAPASELSDDQLAYMERVKAELLAGKKPS